jgi:hypothetical protein
MHFHTTVIGATAILVSLFTSPVSAETNLGGVDMPRACRVQQGSSAQARNDKGQAFTWYCLIPGIGTTSIDVPRACKEQYQSPGAYARAANGNWDSWACYQ